MIFSRFADRATGGGGIRREAQLFELLRPLDFRLCSSWDADCLKKRTAGRPRLLRRLERRFSPERRFWVDADTWHYVFDLHDVAREWRRGLRRFQRAGVALLDDPIYFRPLARALSRAGIPVVALCQNLESLSRSQLNPALQLDLLARELALLRGCRLVVTISREEAFLLRNLGIPALYLPYEPIASIRQRLEAVRQRRAGTRKRGYLALGTAGNKATLEGMKALLSYWKGPDNKLGGDPLWVAGFWTKKYLSPPGAGIELLGEIGDASLDDLLASAKALICYQEFGSGALTKIREMLLAGVPVLANAHAARSYHEYEGKGVFEFSRLEDLESAAVRASAWQAACQTGAPPPPPGLAEAERSLLAQLRSIGGADPGGAPPRVSILLPNLNNRPFLDERLRSIVGQTFADWELVVVDSYSADGAWELFQEWAARDARIRLFQSRQRGIYANWNRCLGLARGEYVLFAPSDDTMEPDFLERMVGALEENPDCDMAQCKLRIIDEKGAPSQKLSWERLFSARALGEWIDRPHVRRAPYDGVLHSGVRTVYTSITQLLIRRRLFGRIGAFSTRFGPAGDFEWGMRAGLLAHVAYVPLHLACWRVHGGQNTDTSRLDAPSRKRELTRMVRHAFRTARRLAADGLRPLRLADLTWLYRREWLAETIREARRQAAPRPLSLGRKLAIGLACLFRDPLLLLEFRRRRRGAGGFLPPTSPLEYPRRLLNKYGLAGNLVATPSASVARPDPMPPPVPEPAGGVGSGPPLLIYQMGKVGSSSVYESLRHAGIGHSLFHVHQLSDKGIKRKQDWLAHFDALSLPWMEEGLRASRELRSWIDDSRERVPWKIITLTRDPVSMKISSFFENIAVYRREVLDAAGALDPVRVMSALRRYAFHDYEENRDYTCSWFQDELETVFGIDVFSVPYDFSRGYTILRRENVGVLVIRLEDLQRSFAPAMEDFLGAPGLKLAQVNAAAGKSSWPQYQAVLREFTLPAELFDRIYSSRYARHFYPPEDRERARARWLRGGALE